MFCFSSVYKCFLTIYGLQVFVCTLTYIKKVYPFNKPIIYHVLDLKLPLFSSITKNYLILNVSNPSKKI